MTTMKTSLLALLLGTLSFTLGCDDAETGDVSLYEVAEALADVVGADVWSVCGLDEAAAAELDGEVCETQLHAPGTEHTTGAVCADGCCYWENTNIYCCGGGNRPAQCYNY
ncbi:hypothetical protein ACNOYE_10845 [Nannocystaceae bacterium ST9]